MADNGSGGPWGQGGGNRGSGNKGGGNRGNGGGRPPSGGGGGQGPDLDDLVRKGQEQLRVLMGGKGGGNNGRKQSGGGGGLGFGGIGLIALAALGLWTFSSFYYVQEGDQSVELTFGECNSPCTNGAGLNFAPWPVVSKEIIQASLERKEDIGVGRGSRADQGLMLTQDQNIVDIDFQVFWNIKDPEHFYFNLASPKATIVAVAESAMREIISRSQLSKVRNTERAAIAEELKELIQSTLDSYISGIQIQRVTFDKAEVPDEVLGAFEAVQNARKEGEALVNVANKHANQVLPRARGNAAEILEKAEAYRARVVNEAEGEASRFKAVYDEYVKAPEVTRKRLYLETIETVYSDVNKVIIDENSEGQGVVPYLPLNELTKSSGGSN